MENRAQIQKNIELLAALERPVMGQPMSVLTSHESQSWYTPPYIIEMVREVLGEIGLDPASDRAPQEWIKAQSYYSQKGLEASWNLRATVFCNPPYGKSEAGSNQALWSQKMAAEYEAGHFKQGILLINSTHGYRWYENLWVRYPVCLARDRIKFIKHDGTVGGQAKRGQTFVYFGADPAKFVQIFSKIGRIVLPDLPPS